MKSQICFMASRNVYGFVLAPVGIENSKQINREEQEVGKDGTLCTLTIAS